MRVSFSLPGDGLPFYWNLVEDTHKFKAGTCREGFPRSYGDI